MLLILVMPQYSGWQCTNSLIIFQPVTRWGSQTSVSPKYKDISCASWEL